MTDAPKQTDEVQNKSKIELNSQPKTQLKEVTDINSSQSSKVGLAALFENTFRKFQTIAFIFFLMPLIILYIFCIGVALFPGMALFQYSSIWLNDQSLWIKALGYGFIAGAGFVGFVFTLIFIVPLANWPIKPFVKHHRGAWYSIEAIPWYYHNALTYLVRYTILEYLTPSPLNLLFFRMMGMKIGKGVLINTTNISDPCLITIDDLVTIGGSAYLMAHYGMKGFLIIDKLHIKKGAMIGLGAKILGGVVIEEKATILPNSAVLPKTTVPAGQKYGIQSVAY